MTPISLVFFGSPDFAGTILEHLIEKGDLYRVLAVVTNPDRPAGRHQELTPSPVAQVAAAHHLPTFKPEKLDPANLAHLKLMRPDIFLVAAYGKIVPPEWLATPTRGTLNIHYSLLPKYRGALCVSEAIKNCDPVTGVTLMEMDRDLDHGPVIAQQEVGIAAGDNVATLTDRLTLEGLKLLDQTLPAYLEGKVTATAQDDAQASYTPSFKARTRQSAFIPWFEIEAAMRGENAQKTDCLIRSLNPDPGAWTKVARDDKELEIKLVETNVTDDRLELIRVQRPGKQPVSWRQFDAGFLSSIRG